MANKSFFAALFVTAFLMMTACNKEQFFDDDFSVESTPSTPSTCAVNTTGETNGISYSLKGLTVNPDVVAINEENAKIESDLQEINNGTLKLSVFSDEIAASLNTGAILYVKTTDFTVLKKITGAEKSGNDYYLLSIEQAQLGEVFEEGRIDVSVDLNKVAFRKASDLNLNNSHEINFHDEYDLGNGLKFNPATDIKLTYNFSLSFVKNQILPSEFSNIFEFQLNINPAFNFEGSINKISNYELTQYIPTVILDYIKSLEINYDIPINILGIESLPSKIKIKDIHMPLAIEANLSKQSRFGYGLNGAFKLGYKINVNGLKAQSTPIFENTFAVNNPSASDIYGELFTNSKIIIEPAITILDGAYTAGGDITMETSTTTYGNVSIPNQQPTVFGSEGIRKISANVLVDLLLIKVPVNIFSQETVLWNIGNIVKSVTYSDMAYKVSSSYSTNLLIASRVYTTDFTLKYKYPILGKRVPDKLLISYDVFQDNGTSKIISVTDQEITLSGITADSFKFQLGIPFRLNILLIPQSKSYIKNIIIKDHNGYVYKGIYNSSKKIVENSFEIKR